MLDHALTGVPARIPDRLGWEGRSFDEDRSRPCDRWRVTAMSQLVTSQLAERTSAGFDLVGDV